jgi:hypothetical protein
VTNLKIPYSYYRLNIKGRIGKGINMTCNVQLEEAIDAIEKLLNSPKAPLILETIRKIKANDGFSNILLD